MMRTARRPHGPVRTGRTPIRLAVAAVSCLAVIGLAAPAAIAGTAASSLVGRAPQAFTGSDMLVSVAATSRTNAWAVGSYFVSHTGKEQPLIEHWNGRGWRLSASPSVGGSTSGYLQGVAALSAKNAWAVGTRGSKALIEHWNGSRWRLVAGRKVASPSWPSSATSILEGVTAWQGTAWAVGQYSVEFQTSSGPISVSYSLILRWTGTRWARVHSPNR